MRYFTFTNTNKFLSKSGKVLNNRYASIVLFSLYACLSLFMLSRHEMWRDEVEAYLMIQNLPIGDWRSYLRHSGHPGLFYFLLMPVRYFDSDLISLKVFNYLICLFTVYFLVFKTKIPRGYLVLLLFGSYMAYRFPSFSRNYSIGFLCLTLSAIFVSSTDFKKRVIGYSSLFLLPHTHLLYVLTAIPWGIYLIIRTIQSKIPKREGAIATFVLFVSGLIFLYFVFPMQDGQFGESLIKNNSIAWEMALPLTFFPGHFSSRFAYPLAWVFFAMLLLWTKENLAIFVYTLIGIIGFLFFFKFIYFAHMNHLSVFLVFVISALILIYSPKSGIKRKTKLAYATVLVFLFSSISQIKFLQKEDWKDIALPYSSAEMSVSALKKCGWEPKSRIAAHPPDEGKTILGYLPRGTEIFFPALDRNGSYMTWDIAFKKAMDFKTVQVFDSLKTKPEIQFLVLNTTENPGKEWEPCPNPGAEKSLVFNEVFYLYKRRLYP